MRIPKFLSPSSLSKWECNREEFYLQYLADFRPPRPPQMDYMSIGSAFDAYVKAALHEALFGAGADPQFEFDTIFVQQVEEHNRDWALIHGEHAFERYVLTGSYDELLAALLESRTDPQFEFTVTKEVNGVPLLGKPDCRYVHKNGAHVILDWKVNGYCSKHGASPYKGYRIIRDGWNLKEKKATRGAGGAHKLYEEIEHMDMAVGGHFLELASKDWADQLSIYAWMLGEEVGGEDAVVCIDQLACKPGPSTFPWVRVANHCCRLSETWQTSLVERLTDCWSTITSGHIFEGLMSREESDDRCEILDMRASAHETAEDGGIEAWVCEIARESIGFRKR